MLVRIEVDVVKVNTLRPEDQEQELESLILFPGGYQIRMPEVVADTILEAVADGIIPSPYPKPTPKVPVRIARETGLSPEYQPEPAAEEARTEDTKTKICIECQCETEKLMPSGKCYRCADVRCPTCKRTAKASDMIGGQYCPNCLPREG